MKAQSKFLVGSGIIVATLVMLAYVGFTQSKTYYHTISELGTLQGAKLQQHMRVSGNVRKGSISRSASQIDFVLEEQGKALPVTYIGRDPLPDTFKDGAQALAEGKLSPDGHFVADQIQAKCASKYQAVPNSTPASTASSQTMNSPEASAVGGKN